MNMVLVGAIALGLSIGAAAAQTGNMDQTVGAAPPATRIELDPTQRTAIYNAVRSENRKIIPSAELQPSVGTQVPPSMELYILPDQALTEAPAAKIFKYTMVQNQVVLVDPTTLRVVDVIDQSTAR